MKLAAAIGCLAIGRIASRGGATFFKTGLDRRSALGNMIVGADGNVWFADHGKRPGDPGRADHRVPRRARSEKQAGGPRRRPGNGPGPGEIRLDSIGLLSARTG